MTPIPTPQSLKCRLCIVTFFQRMQNRKGWIGVTLQWREHYLSQVITVSTISGKLVLWHDTMKIWHSTSVIHLPNTYNTCLIRQTQTERPYLTDTPQTVKSKKGKSKELSECRGDWRDRMTKCGILNLILEQKKNRR